MYQPDSGIIAIAGASTLRRSDSGNAAVVGRVQIAVVAIVAAEQLIAAVAADHDLHVLSRELREQPRAQRQRIGRLIERPHQIRQVRGDLRLHSLFVMIGLEQLGDGARRGRFVEALIAQVPS